jgi:hypothetical protein
LGYDAGRRQLMQAEPLQEPPNEVVRREDGPIAKAGHVGHFGVEKVVVLGLLVEAWLP